MREHQKIIYQDIQEIVRELGDEVNALSGKALLITGATGLLGSYLVETVAFLNDRKILKKPCNVLSLQRSEVKEGSRLGHLVNRADIQFIKHNAIEPYSPSFPVDYIVHAACKSAPAFFQADPLGTIDVNVKGLRWILDYAKDSKIKSVLFMSSGETYGDPTPENIPTAETYNGNVSPLAPRACYTESKRLGETLCSIYYKKFGVPVKIARPFIVYGPGLSIEDRRAMADFIRSGIAGKPIEMLSEGLDTRSYCYISDATVLFWKILFSDKNCEPYNVASDIEEVSIRRLAELVHEICGVGEPVGVKQTESTNFVSDAPTRVLPDISKARRDFGYDPKVGIREGLARTIAWNKAKFNDTS